MLKRRNYRNNENHIKTEINKIDDKKKQKQLEKIKKNMIHDYNNKYLENLHFDEARAIFMMLT